MSTKAELFRSQSQRTHQTEADKSQRSPSAEAGPPRRSKGQLPPDERDDVPTIGVKQHGTRAQKHAAVKVEVSQNGKASRKSTRASANRSKSASVLTKATTSKNRSPKVRAAKAQAARATHAGAKKV